MTTTNQDNQINELNSLIKAKIGVSKIHGVGVIALCDIKAGEKLHLDDFPKLYNLSYANLSKLFPHIKTLILEHYPNVVNGQQFSLPDSRVCAYMNHSDSPSYDPKTDTATKDIATGEEITEDYREIPNYHKVFTWL